MTDEIEAKIRIEISRIFNTDASMITRDTLLEQIGDSLKFVELIMSAESLFKIEILDAAAAQVKTFGQLIELIQSMLQ